MLQRNSWQIRQGVNYFMRDVTFGASLAKYSAQTYKERRRKRNNNDLNRV